MLAGNHPYRKMGRPRVAPTVAGKGQKSHRNYVEDPMGETHNSIVRRSYKGRGYSTIYPPYGGNRAQSMASIYWSTRNSPVVRMRVDKADSTSYTIPVSIILKGRFYSTMCF